MKAADLHSQLACYQAVGVYVEHTHKQNNNIVCATDHASSTCGGGVNFTRLSKNIQHPWLSFWCLRHLFVFLGSYTSVYEILSMPKTLSGCGMENESHFIYLLMDVCLTGWVN
jgi:hypothetical protein